jgi:hypothetical protein
VFVLHLFRIKNSAFAESGPRVSIGLWNMLGKRSALTSSFLPSTWFASTKLSLRERASGVGDAFATRIGPDDTALG